jgi:hypothetical protein
LDTISVDTIFGLHLIRPPTDIVSKGRTKRIKKSKEIPVPRKRKCGKCKQIVSDHDARNCPNNIVG